MAEQQVDYLIVGAGAMAFAFADMLLQRTDATIALVDRNDKPGGHWNYAYPFVRLHQPSSGYGIESRDLGEDKVDVTGWNEGMLELASVAEILTYYEQVLKQDFLPTGRVHYYPMCEYADNGTITSLVSGKKVPISVRHKTVDTTHQHVSVPAMRPPPYHVAEGVACVSPDRIVRISGQYDQYTVVGAGKTGIDVCLWLLEHGVEPAQIRWIMPRDSWLVNRKHSQPGPQFAEDATAYATGQLLAIQAATNTDDLFTQLEEHGILLRLDKSVTPTMYRCATVSEKEIEALRAIKSLVRMGRVTRIEKNAITLEGGEIETGPTTLHIDCTADGLEKRPSKPIFDGQHITLQSIRPCQQVFSAALIGLAETLYDSDDEKNKLCVPVPHPDTDKDWIRVSRELARSEQLWSSVPELRDWLLSSRLNWIWRLGEPFPEGQKELDEFLGVRSQLLAMMDSKLAELETQGS